MTTDTPSVDPLTPEQMATQLSAALDDDTRIYHPQWNSFTGSTNATILLSQIQFRWQKKKRQPFYKFLIPCAKHAAYRPGDSWQEEISLGRAALTTARSELGRQIKVAQGETADDVFAEGKLIAWYTDQSHLTWYYLNEQLLGEKLLETYGLKPKPAGAIEAPEEGCEEADFPNPETSIGEDPESDFRIPRIRFPDSPNPISGFPESDFRIPLTESPTESPTKSPTDKNNAVAFFPEEIALDQIFGPLPEDRSEGLSAVPDRHQRRVEEGLGSIPPAEQPVVEIARHLWWGINDTEADLPPEKSKGRKQWDHAAEKLLTETGYDDLRRVAAAIDFWFKYTPAEDVWKKNNGASPYSVLDPIRRYYYSSEFEERHREATATDQKGVGEATVCGAGDEEDDDRAAIESALAIAREIRLPHLQVSGRRTGIYQSAAAAG